MAEQFKYLFSPIKIGSMTVRNRITVSGHTTFYTSDGLSTEGYAHYLAEKAKGGVGLLVTEVQGIHPTSPGGLYGYAFCYEERVVPRWRLMGDMVHEHGAKLLAQLWHGGQHGESGAQGYEWRQIWAPSAVSSVSCPTEAPKEMELEDIKELVNSYARSAYFARQAGLDGVELHAAHGYLIGQFFSPISNKRTDDYGLSNRLHFAFDVIEAVRKEVGKDFVVGMRISADEFTPGGLTTEDTKVIAADLEKHGGLDYFSVSGATYNCIHLIAATMDYPLGFFVPLASEIRSAVSVPVICVNRVNDPIQAEHILADGHADMVAMTRAHIADPEMANKAREGRLDDIRTCLGCNQGCQSRVFLARPITCIQNAAAGREKALGTGTLKPATSKKNVIVVGGGPAGMEAARVLATRGHSVELYDKSQELGGQVTIAAKGPHREDWAGITRFLSIQLIKLGVKTNLGTEITSEDILAKKADAVVLATGSTPERTGFTSALPTREGIPGVNASSILTDWEVLNNSKPLGNKVVVVDDVGNWRASIVVEALVDQGKRVDVLTRFPFFGQSLLPSKELIPYLQRVMQKDLSFHTSSMVEEIQGRKVIFYNVYSNKKTSLEDVDSVVLVMGRKANNELYKDLKGKIKELYTIGDCVAPRGVAQAIYEGNLLGRQI